MRRFAIKSWVLAFVMIFGACSPAASAEPTISSEDIQSTAVAAALTIVAETQVSIPTNTPIPPTETSAPTLPPTETPLPSPTVDSSSVSPTAQPTLTAQVASGTTDPCNQVLTQWEGPSAKLSLTYEYTPQSNKDKQIISIWVMTDRGECGFLADLSTGPVGQYTVTAFIDSAKPFKVRGGFRINGGSWRIVIRNDTITALGGCYPDC